MRSDHVAVSLAADAPDSYAHPDLAPASVWPGVMIIIILIGFFVTAMVLGPIVRTLMQDELEPLESPMGKTTQKRAG